MADNDNQATDDPTQATATFLSAFILYIAVGCAALIGFFILRTHFQIIYSPKTNVASRFRQNNPAPSKFIPFLRSFLLGNRHLRGHMVGQLGLDGVVFLRYLRLCGSLFAAFTVLGLPILGPVCAVGQGNLKGINSITFGNITSNRRLWAHLILSWIFVGMYWERGRDGMGWFVHP
ncbi:late exocytosis, associated with Golgi transport-domain-containing protein [Piptocephalis cylindrospora]|uniref:Late exocytosis, associated with Golgi transport-domain-containing protein n=1 Tax=Piptocephalis cylindrospora TaxID=1907219 RepID=A0A4P9Y6A2_9FUNG|nr:late exocytosis, associated with Golgi transport-domain-containing protein [Piptocephalis cylindrospora]|eukprot:RKP13761.1 late exocytosis, associated with Golgi transport-domain-containing protein [Piptocephalis cylindrospora]